MWFTQKTILLGALSAETITYLSWRRDMCLATFGSLKIGVELVLIDPSGFSMIICLSDNHGFVYTEERSLKYPSITFTDLQVGLDRMPIPSILTLQP